MIFSYLLNMQSHPSWVCGLKLTAWYFGVRVLRVTPFVGVWIETYKLNYPRYRYSSHPSWVCGLKQDSTVVEHSSD